MKTPSLLSRSIPFSALALSAVLAACSDNNAGAGGAGGAGGTADGFTGSTSSATSSSSGPVTPQLKFITEFDPAKTEFPEGLAVTPDSKSAYVTLAPLLKVVSVSLPDGKVTDFATLPAASMPNVAYALGLIIAASGDVYVPV